jgi:surface protein
MDTPIHKWDVSTLKDLSFVFDGVHTFNEDISSWKMFHRAAAMLQMLFEATTFHQDFVILECAKCRDHMFAMFEGADAFNQKISKWNVSSVINMSRMFRRAKTFKLHLSNWNVQKVTNMHAMFEDADAFNQNISRWNVSSVTDMNRIHPEPFRLERAKCHEHACHV